MIVFSLAGSVFIKSQSNKSNKSQDQQQNDKKKTQSTFVAPASFIYGYWTNDKSIIAVLDLSTSQNGVLAELASNVKHVKILDPQKIIYIKDTDTSDYGKQLVIRNLDSKTETTVMIADDGFGIDDYVVSPNSKYLAVWEVSLSETGTLFGGKSRLYTLDITNSSKKNLIYDETSGIGIILSYPIAITDNGDLFTDRFLPNSGAGWGYGISISNFTGTNRQDIPSLANGMISTQPEVSPDGKKLLFAGYDGRKGIGTAEINGFRRAMLMPNTIEIFDLLTRQKRTLLSAQGDDIFSDVSWDLLTGNIIYSLVSNNESKNSTYSYNLNTNASERININDMTNILAAVSANQYITFDVANSDSTLGNLGGKLQSINKFSAYR